MLDLGGVPHSAVLATVYRVVHKGVDPLSSQGSELNGGRYSSPGTKGVLYASFDQATAVAEVAKGLKMRGINTEDYGPDDWWAYELGLISTRALDLTDPKLLEKLHISRTALLGDDLALTREVAKEALAAGYDALIVPSAALGQGKNVVIFLSAAGQVPTVKASTPVDLSKEGGS